MAINIKKIKNRAKITVNYIRDSFWDLKDVYNLLKKNKNKNKYFYINKNKIKTSSQKNNLFIQNYEKYKNKCKCDICGLEAKYMVLEKSKDVVNDYFHFNLYTINKDNQEIYFNIDHVIPKSKGGKNELENMQLTCEICNSKKANKFNKFTHYILIIKKYILSLYHKL